MATYYDPNWFNYCVACRKHKTWYNFKDLARGKEGVCLRCQDRQSKDIIILKLDRLLTIAMKNKMSDLRNHLFETIESLRDNSITPEKAKAVCEVAQVIINSAKVELDFLKVIGGKKSDFLQIEDKELTNGKDS